MYEQKLEEVKDFLLTSRQGRQKAQQTFDDKITELQQYGFSGFKPEFFYTLLETPIPLSVRQRLGRYLRNSKVVIPQEITTRRYYMCDGTTTENPTSKTENEELKKEDMTKTEQRFYTSYNIMRKTIYFYRNNKYHEFEKPKEEKEKIDYEHIRTILKETKNALSEKVKILMAFKEMKMKEKADNSITEFFKKWF